MSDFLEDIRKARRSGRLDEWFRDADVRRACPGWDKKTYLNFLSKHRVGNPLKLRAYFVRRSDGMYRLIEEGPDVVLWPSESRPQHRRS